MFNKLQRRSANHLHPHEIVRRLAASVDHGYEEYSLLCRTIGDVRTRQGLNSIHGVVAGAFEEVKALDSLSCSGVSSHAGIEAWLRTDRLAAQLGELAGKLGSVSQDLNGSVHDALARMVLHKFAAGLNTAVAQLAPFLAPSGQAQGAIVSISTDLLFGVHQTLFPAERMAVISGRTTDDGTVLGTCFDVTGRGLDTHSCHVTADPEKLARALIAMHVTGTHLAAWIHSHPGGGAGATTPSTTDRRQHDDWLRDYSKRLLGLIVVHDRFLRVWGTAAEQDDVVVRFAGSGVAEVDGSKRVYRLEY